MTRAPGGRNPRSGAVAERSIDLVIGLTGPNAAGKGEVASVLVERGFVYHSLSDVVREEATARGLDHSRENLIRVGNDLRARFGPGVLAERIAARIAGSLHTTGGPPPTSGAYPGRRVEPVHQDGRAAPIPGVDGDQRSGAGGQGEVKTGAFGHIVDSIRSPAEVAVLKSLPGFVLLGIDAPVALRFERSKARGRLGDGATLEEFTRKEALENSNDPAAQQLTQTLTLADIVVWNEGTLEDLRRKVATALGL